MTRVCGTPAVCAHLAPAQQEQSQYGGAEGEIEGMAIVLGETGVDELSEVVGVLREWQYDGASIQLHPGDLGWFWRFGAEATAATVRTWSRDGQTLAVGLQDHPKLLRLTIAPDAQRDEELAQQLVEDVTKPTV
ncbi:hypothetical protein ACFXJ8_32925 [Nonomuraea sp. NPDC059194]|uniref:hypothetical protein n=1 Tax=Nonomuraea sp. NPDC059194 TaxID=3346764 RepID=UPI00368CFBBF